MKRIKFILIILSVISLNAQTTLYSESFETDEFNVNYVMNRFSDGGQDYFGVVDAWGNTQFITANFLNPFTFEMTNLDGVFCIGAEDLKRQDNPLNSNLDDYRGYFITKTIDVSDYENVEVRLLIGAKDPGVNGTVEANDNDAVRIQYAFDSDIADGANNLTPGLTNESSVYTGNYTDIGRFLANAPTNGSLQQDTNLDNTPDGVILDNSMVEFVFVIPVTGTNLSVRIHMDYDDSAEEVVFDYLRLIGTTTAAIAGENFNKQIKFYPNPMSSFSLISLGKIYTQVNIETTNILGQIVDSKTYNSIDEISNFEIKGHKGIYFININADNNRTTFKVIKN